MYPHRFHNTRSLPEVIATKLPLPDRKQIVEIILLKTELLHDIKSNLVRLERTRKSQVPIFIDNDDYQYTICRKVDDAVGRVVSRMQAYLLLPSPYAHRIATNHTHEWEEKSIYLALPYNWPPHNIDALRDAVHNYIVKYALFQFLAETLPDDKLLPVLERQYTDLYDNINANINDRLGPMNIYPSFLG